MDSLNQAIERVGYTVRGENGISNRRYFTKGGNQRSHHIHAFTTGDAQIIKHLATGFNHKRPDSFFGQMDIVQFYEFPAYPRRPKAAIALADYVECVSGKINRHLIIA